MHCDDKRTIFVLKQLILDSNLELQKSMNQLKNEKDDEKKVQIQRRINELEKTIQDSKEQLESMN